MKRKEKNPVEKPKRKWSLKELKGLYHETIKGKITLTVLALVIVSLTLLGVISSVLNNHSTNSTLERNMNATAKVASERVEWELIAYRNLAEDLGLMTRLSGDTATVEEKQAIIDERVKGHDLVRGNILDASGISVFSGEDFSDRDYFKAAMQGESYVSEPLVSKTTGELTIIISAPMWKDGVKGTEVIGVVYLVPEETFLNDIMLAINVSANGSAYMLDGQGNVIAHKNIELVKSKDNSIADAKTNSALKPVAKLEQKMLDGKTGFGTYRYGGVKKIMAYTPIENSNGWSIAITAPISDFNGETVAGVIITIVIVVVSIVLSVILVRRLADNIGNPIQMCAKRLEELAKGDLHTEIPQIDSRDEVRILANATQNIVTGMEKIIVDIEYILGEMAENNFDVHSRAEEFYVGDFHDIITAVRQIKQSLSVTLTHIKESADQVGLGGGTACRERSGACRGSHRPGSFCGGIACYGKQYYRSGRA